MFVTLTLWHGVVEFWRRKNILNNPPSLTASGVLMNGKRIYSAIRVVITIIIIIIVLKIRFFKRFHASIDHLSWSINNKQTKTVWNPMVYRYISHTVWSSYRWAPIYYTLYVCYYFWMPTLRIRIYLPLTDW